MLPAPARRGQVIHPRRVRVPAWLLAPAAPLVKVAAAAGGGFLAGVALMGLVHRRRRRGAIVSARRRKRPAARAQASRRGGEVVQVVGSRSLLVDVHLLGDR